MVWIWVWRDVEGWEDPVAILVRIWGILKGRSMVWEGFSVDAELVG